MVVCPFQEDSDDDEMVLNNHYTEDAGADADEPDDDDAEDVVGDAEPAASSVAPQMEIPPAQVVFFF